MQEYEPVWQRRTGSTPAELFGFRFDVGLDPVTCERRPNGRGISARLSRNWARSGRPRSARRHARGRAEAWRLACRKARGAFHLDDELWARVVLDFACAYQRHPIRRGVILRSLTPLYLARVASFVRETENLVAAEVEDKIEQLCLTFEEPQAAPGRRWNGEPASSGESRPAAGS